jgi:hypothetical protein
MVRINKNLVNPVNPVKKEKRAATGAAQFTAF